MKVLEGVLTIKQIKNKVGFLTPSFQQRPVLGAVLMYQMVG